MSPEFTRSGALMDLRSYPLWLQDIVAKCRDAEQRIAEHELFHRMANAALSKEATWSFMVGAWPVIEQFPKYMAMNLLKVEFGRSPGHNMARRYLIRNIRVEQQHAELWLLWAEACGIPRAQVLEGSGSVATEALSHWCWHTCHHDPLPIAMAATNYAIEGVTGRWCALVCSTSTYEKTFAPEARRDAMKWLRAHAEYDDRHPWEALEIIATMLGTAPDIRDVDLVCSRVRRSYEYMCMTLDDCLMQDVAPTRVMNHGCSPSRH